MTKRLFALLLALVMTLSLCPVTVLAETTEEPIASATSMEEPVDEEPIDEEPIDEEPIDEEPVDEEPIDEEPVDEEPIGEEFAGEKPVRKMEMPRLGASGGTHNHTGWEEWNNNKSLPNKAGNYYLTTDVTMSYSWGVSGGTVNFCLNGHVIQSSNNNATVTVTNGGGAESLRLPGHCRA